MKKIALIIIIALTIFTGCQESKSSSIEDKFANKNFRMETMFGTKFLTIDKSLKWTMNDDGEVLPNSKVDIKTDNIVFYYKNKAILKAKYLYDNGVTKFDIYEQNGKKSNSTQLWIDESKAEQICFNYATKDAIDFLMKGKKELDCDGSLTHKINEYYKKQFKNLQVKK
ncbi:MAG: hypothetical protein WBF48_03120 [Halarcobacter sp.]